MGTQDFPPPPRERALARSASLADRKVPAAAEQSNYHCDFDKFLAAISAPEKLPTFGPSDRQSAGEHNHIKDFGAGHYYTMQEEFSNLAEHLKRDPEGTKRFLSNTGSWKYWGLQLERAHERDKLFRQSRDSAPSAYA